MSTITKPMSMAEQRRAALRAESERERRAQEARFIMDPGQWPRWPLLPVKKSDKASGGFPVCALMLTEGLGDMTPPLKVYEGLNLFDERKQDPAVKTWGDYLKLATAVHEFADVEALLDAGWRVD